MKIPKEVQCVTCLQVFCCAKCRAKHEDISHKEIKAIRQICYICNNRPFPLRTDTKITPNNLLIEHILKEHLPLRCNRCAKIFHTAADFKSISRCFTNSDKTGAPGSACQLVHNTAKIPTITENAENLCDPKSNIENKENIKDNCNITSSDHSTEPNDQVPQTTIKIVGAANVTMAAPKDSKELRAVTTDPIEEICDINKATLTPLSMINLRWKRKSRQSFDSMLCVTSNISAVNASSEDAGCGPPSPSKKLARTTSTPMIHGCWSNRKAVANESYTSAMGHMSSIHHSNSSSESESKTADRTPPTSPAPHAILPKVRDIKRNRSRVVATPLRQVMSKSIQRAIAQHGCYSKMLPSGTQRKMSFNSTNSSGLSSSSDSSSRASALDLRTTPVLKRASSESAASSELSMHKTAKMICLPPPKRNEECEETGEASSNYYATHQSLETSSELIDQENRKNQRIDDESLIVHQKPKSKSTHNYQDTPKVAGGILKKVITFKTPDMSRLRENKDEILDDDKDEVWATPCAVLPRSFSCSAIGDSRLDSIMTEDNSDASGSDDVFMPPAKTLSCQQQHKLATQPVASTGRLWTIVTNVMRLASRSDGQEQPTSAESVSSEENSKVSSNLLKKAASFAGFLKDHFPVRTSQSQQHGSNSSSGSEEFAIPRNPEAGASLKRRRTGSLYTRPYEFIGNAAAGHRLTSSSPLAKRVKRIQGRLPIQRMRSSSSKSDGSGSEI